MKESFVDFSKNFKNFKFTIGNTITSILCANINIIIGNQVRQDVFLIQIELKVYPVVH